MTKTYLLIEFVEKKAKAIIKLVFAHILYKLASLVIPIYQAYKSIHSPRRILSDKAVHIFFGYYDINPIDYTETRLLVLKIDAPLRTPEPGIFANVGYYRLQEEKPEFIPVGQTQTWNWQQGCRLQWYPSDVDLNIFYNVFCENHYSSVVQNLLTGNIIRIIDYPVYDLDLKGKFGLSLNFSRLQRLRPGYGYVNLPDTTEHALAPKNDGIWLVNFDENRTSLLFSIADVASIEPQYNMKNAQHYFNHISINPSGTDFLFFHLWLDGANHRHSRLFSANIRGDRITLLNKTGPVSHYTWLSDERMVVTTYNSQNQSRYFQYHYVNGFECIVGDKQLTEDGHPTYIMDGKMLITDTYPNNYREQKLLLFNTITNKTRVLDRVVSPPIFEGEIRCDLHPRPSTSSNLVCIDMVKNKYRAIKVIDLSKFNNYLPDYRN
jgi:hypothetical protein